MTAARQSAQIQSAPTVQPIKDGGQTPADGAILVGTIASRDAAESSFAQFGARSAALPTEYPATYAAAQQYTETDVVADDSVQILDDLTNRNGGVLAADSRRGVGQDVNTRDGNVASDYGFDAASPAAVPPAYPLPHRTYKFDILDHAPARHPSAPLAHKPLETMTSQERSEEHLRAQHRLARERAQRELREAAGNNNEWAREWIDVKGKQRENTQNTIYHSASFFPHAHLPGLEYMRGIFAVIGRDQIELHQANLESSAASTSARTARSTIMLARYKLPPRSTDPRDAEELFTCTWSVNITTNPYTPMLAVAGRGRTIEVFLIGQRSTGEWLVHLDRTITGHGGSIFHLTFHPSYPHLLASCSEDKTVRLWDATVPWGTNKAVHDVTMQTRRLKTVEKQQQQLGYRPRVEGELLALLAERGHEQAVFSCDMHAVQPLLLTAGADGYIRLWTLPQSVLDATPFWPTMPLHRPPSKPPPKSSLNDPVPVLGPPFFSSYAIHPGQWPDQVLFASPTTCTIISKAGVSHEDGQFSPRKSVKVWVPDVLDVLAPRCAANRDQEDSALREKEKSALPSLTEMRSHLPVDARSDSAFRIMYEAVLEDQNCIADKIGWFQPRPNRPPSSPPSSSSAQDAFFALSTSTKLPALTTKQTNRAHSPPALYLFRTFANPSMGVKQVRRDSQNLSFSSTRSSNVSSSLRRSTTSLAESPSGSQIQTGSHPSIGAGPDELVEALFPPTRDRQAHDFVPRLLPSRVLDFASPPSPSPSSASRAEEQPSPPVHARCIAIDPQDAETIVAVGDHGLLAVWSKSKV